MSICDMNCLECKFSECINDSDVLSSFERSLSKDIDASILNSTSLTYNQRTHKRHNKEVDTIEYRKAQNKHFHAKYYSLKPKYYRKKGRENYRKHRGARLESMRKYAEEHKEEISANKKTYYQEHREEILAKRKANYTPKEKKPLIDSLEAEAKRQRERERYHKNKEEINRKRRERRKQKRESSKD